MKRTYKNLFLLDSYAYGKRLAAVNLETIEEHLRKVFPETRLTVNPITLEQCFHNENGLVVGKRVSELVIDDEDSDPVKLLNA